MKKQELALIAAAVLGCCFVLLGCKKKETIVETKADLKKFLVGYCKMDDNAADTKVIDSSGYDHSGVCDVATASLSDANAIVNRCFIDPFV